MAEDRSVVEVLLEGYRGVQSLFSEWERTPYPARQREIMDQAMRELGGLLLAEEEHVLPTVGAEVPDGGRIAEEQRQLHEHLDEVMNRLRETDAEDVNFQILARRLVNDARFQAQRDRVTVLPALEGKLSATRLRQLGDEVSATRRAHSTR
jgi:hypothetical protein